MAPCDERLSLKHVTHAQCSSACRQFTVFSLSVSPKRYELVHIVLERFASKLFEVQPFASMVTGLQYAETGGMRNSLRELVGTVSSPL